MQSSQFSSITDELLSAYLDDDLSYRERELVEAAIAADAEVAWRLESLRQTVRLLNNLPEIVPKRSFLLNESMVGDVTRARREVAVRRRQAMGSGSAAVASHALSGEAVESGSWWANLGRNWRAFWHGGNPVLRNLATASLVLALFIAGADTLLTQPASPAAPEMFVLEQESVAPAPAAQAPQAAASLSAPQEDAPPIEAMRAAEMPADEMGLAAVDEDTAEDAKEAGAEEDAEEMVTAAMAAPDLATPAVVEGEEGEAVTLDAEVETLAVAVPEEDMDEGGFGDAAAPGLLHSEPGMGGGPDEIGGFGGGGDDGAGPAMPMPLGEPDGEPRFVDEEETVALDEALLDEVVLDETATDELAAEEPVTDGSELELAPEARVAMVEEPAEEPVEDAEEADSEGAARIAIVPTQTAPGRELAPSAGEAVTGTETDLAVEDTVTTDTVATDTRLADGGAEDDVAAEDHADRALVAEVESEPEAAIDTGAMVAIGEPAVGAREPVGVRVLSWLQWGLLMVAMAFSALWWRSRN